MIYYGNKNVLHTYRLVVANLFYVLLVKCFYTFICFILGQALMQGPQQIRGGVTVTPSVRMQKRSSVSPTLDRLSPNNKKRRLEIGKVCMHKCDG